MANSEKESLMKQIQATGFAIDDVILFLDTHPNDANALAFYQKNKNAYQQLVEEYTVKFGPLTIRNVEPSSKWPWAADPWPWQREG